MQSCAINLTICAIASKNKCYPLRCQIVRKKMQHSVITECCINKFDLCYYGQVNSLPLKSSVASKWAGKHLWGVPFILLAMVQLLYKPGSSMLCRVKSAQNIILGLVTAVVNASVSYAASLRTSLCLLLITMEHQSMFSLGPLFFFISMSSLFSFCVLSVFSLFFSLGALFFSLGTLFFLWVLSSFSLGPLFFLSGSSFSFLSGSSFSFLSGSSFFSLGPLFPLSGSSLSLGPLSLWVLFFLSLGPLFVVTQRVSCFDPLFKKKNQILKLERSKKKNSVTTAPMSL